MILGFLSGLLYSLLTAISMLSIDKLISNIDSITALFLTTLIAFFYFTIINITKLKKLLRIIFIEWKITLLINISVVFMWGSVYLGLKHLTPVDFMFLFELFCAMSALLRHKNIFVLILSLLLFAVYLGFEKTNNLGIIIAAVGGSSAYLYAVLTGIINRRQKITPSEILTIRFTLLLLLSFKFIHITPEILTFHAGILIVFVTTISYIIPIYFLQKSICIIGAEKASFLATSIPLFTYILQAIFLGIYSFKMLILSVLLFGILNDKLIFNLYISSLAIIKTKINKDTKILLTELNMPIQMVNISEFNIDLNVFVNEIIGAYDHYEEDYYLTRQHKIEYLKKYLPDGILANLSHEFWIKFYSFGISDEEEKSLVSELAIEEREKYHTISATRFRLISEFELSFKEDNWTVERTPVKPFEQMKALIVNERSIDYRLLTKRIFKELPPLLETDSLKKIMIGYANKIKQNFNKINHLNIIVHHVVICYSSQNESSNSPEGVHQDGMDFIVSALLVERKNIKGGESIIFGKDKVTKLFQTTLESGQSILQSDRDTDLWHKVSAIKPIDPLQKAYRSTLGFDISIRT